MVAPAVRTLKFMRSGGQEILAFTEVRRRTLSLGSIHCIKVLLILILSELFIPFYLIYGSST